jgi:hypothetical protein
LRWLRHRRQRRTLILAARLLLALDDAAAR